MQEDVGQLGPRSWRRAALRALVPLAGAGVLWALGRTTGAAVAAVSALLLLVIGLAAPWAAEELDHLLARLAERVTHVVATALAAIAWVVLVAPTWALSRLCRYDPLDGGWTSVATAWSPNERRVRRSPGPRHLGARELRPVRRVRARGHLRAVPVVALLGVALAVAWSGRPVGTDAGATAGSPGSAWFTFNAQPVYRWSFPGEPWARELLSGTGDSGAVQVGGRIGWIPRDGTSRFIHTRGNARRTLTVPHPQVTVFLFGGSTTFGVGQRDEHTIASELVRQASARGLPIRVVNRGVSGFVNWQETGWLRSLVESGKVPDVAVFFDGGNDGALAWDRIQHGYVDPEERMTMAVSDEERAARESHAREIGWTPPRNPERLWVDLVATQYRAGVLEARDLGARYGFETVHFWQPQLMTIPADRPRVVDLAVGLGTTPSQLARDASMLDRARRRSRVDPIDLTGVFDHVEQPVFFDWVHTNEAGTRMIAAAMLDRLWPVLQRAREDR